MERYECTREFWFDGALRAKGEIVECNRFDAMADVMAGNLVLSSGKKTAQKRAPKESTEAAK